MVLQVVLACKGLGRCFKALRLMLIPLCVCASDATVGVEASIQERIDEVVQVHGLTTEVFMAKVRAAKQVVSLKRSSQRDIGERVDRSWAEVSRTIFSDSYYAALPLEDRLIISHYVGWCGELFCKKRSEEQLRAELIGILTKFRKALSVVRIATSSS